MNHSSTAWWDLGYYGVFLCVFLEQIGAPIPAFPALLSAGALAASGELALPDCLLTAVAAALLADIVWYGLGYAKGHSVLNLLCRLSWKPDTCISKTKDIFARRGVTTLLFAKFLPGLSTLAPPLAGMARVSLVQFILYDAVGTVVWAFVPLLAGLYLHHSLVSLQTSFEQIKAWLPWICGIIIVAVLVWRYWNRRRYFHSSESALRDGISPQHLQNRLHHNEEVVIVDVRHPMDVKELPIALPNALLIPYSALVTRLGDLPLSKNIVTYCDCPKDEAAVAAAQFLTKAGAKNARPLLGGLKGWRELGFATIPADA
ncbi:MAG TPA: VTT domain-containing protein [Candidatus Methylacidiphilales bacterium]|nr:VTT domain-containing protein [Candidatus Methylacidiphilales bacterium]